jgi:serine/threonine protein kinase
VAELQDSKTPQRFGRYVLLDRLAAGGMAEVFRAVVLGAEGFRRSAVVKLIRPEFSSSEAFLGMFVNEARISALLNHPNIVQIYDFGCVEGRYFLAMEYLPGKDLSTVLGKLSRTKKRLDAGIAAFVVAQVAHGLAYAHSLALPGGEALNIVHRDVTPSNIMLLRPGGVKLLDFGIAKAEHHLGRAEHTDSGVRKGKWSYFSPEQMNGGRLDGRSDIFSLGVVLWEALTGQSLFQGKSQLESMQNVAERPIPPPSTVRPELPTALDYVALRALERDPDRRYASAATLAEELETILQDLRYHSHALPDLLEQLFGLDTHEVDVPLSDLPPEPSVPEVEVDVERTRRERSAAATVDLGGWRLRPARLRWLGAGGMLLLLLMLGLGHLGARADRKHAPAPVEVRPTAAAPVRPARPAVYPVTRPPSTRRPVSRPPSRSGTERARRKRPSADEERQADALWRTRHALTLDPFEEPTVLNEPQP